MSKIEYPKYLYHSDGRSALVPDADAHADLGDGWDEAPLGQPDAVAVAEDTQADVAEAEAQAVYEASVAEIAGHLAGSSRASLERLVAIESANPKGPRKGILKAVAEALAKLDA